MYALVISLPRFMPRWMRFLLHVPCPSLGHFLSPRQGPEICLQLTPCPPRVSLDPFDNQPVAIYRIRS